MLTKICKNKKTQGILAIFLIITMIFANILFLGKNLISYAFETDLEAQNENTQSNNVRFDAYFNDNGGKNVHSAIFDATNNAVINLHLAVKDAGYLKEAYIDFRDGENSNNTNYEIVSDLGETTLIQSVNKELKTISLNFVDYGTDAVIQIPVRTEIPNLMDINKLKQGTKVTLRGIYVDRLGQEIEILKTVKLNLGWTLETELNLEQSVVKYIPYTNNEQSGMLLQMQVKAKQNREDFALPVKQNEIKIQVPEIANILPESAIVIADGTLATNGDKIEFSQDNWTYNKEEGTITINAEMYQEEGKVWAGTAADTYLITYIYPNTLLGDETTITSNIEAKMEVFSAEGVIEKTATLNQDITLNDEIGSIVTYNVKADKEEISKGRMYANCNSNTKTYDTAYGLTVKANVSNYETVEKLTFKIPTDSFIKEEKEYSIPNTYVNQITINKAKMQKVLGEDGFVKISDVTGTYIINSETEDIDGNYIINLDEQISNIIVETSAPIANEIFKLDVRKIISKDLAYSKIQLQRFDSLKINIYANGDTISDTIALTETSTNAKLEMSNVDLVSSTENKDVNFKIMLNNSSENSDLYKNAVFEIALPKYIEDIYGMANILYSSGLKIDKIEKVNTENGIVLKISTTGAENMFSDGVLTNGAVITVDATLKIGEVLENVTDKVVLTYTNANAVSYMNEGKEEVNVNFIARQKPETLTTNPDTVVNPELTADPDAKATLDVSTKLMYQDEEIVSTGSVKEKQEVTYITTIKNTSTVDAKNVELVTKIQNGKILNTTMKILDKEGNILTTKDHKADGDSVTEFISTWGTIPAKGSGILECTVMTNDIEKISEDEDKKVTNTIKVTADNVDGEIKDSVGNNLTASKVEILMSGSRLSNLLNEDEVFTFINIRNISDSEITNLTVTQKIPEGLEYIDSGDTEITYDKKNNNLKINIAKIDKGDAYNKTISWKVKLPEGKGRLNSKTNVTVKLSNGEIYKSNSLIFELSGVVLSVNLTSTISNGSYVKEGKHIKITGTLENKEGIKAQPAVLKLYCPDEINVDNAYYYDKSGNKVDMFTGSENVYSFLVNLEQGEKVKFELEATPLLEENLDEKEISIYATAKWAKMDEVKSNVLTYKIEKDVTNPDNPNPDNPTIKTYRISGKAWLDENKDGKLDENEKLLEGINALLIDAKTGVIVTDRTNGTIKETKTSSSGTYSFSNLLPGSYIVIFEYDSILYNITEYSKIGVTEDLSSKAIQTDVVRDGITKVAGATNTLIISDSSIANVNIGLVENPKFDLSLKMELSKATIVNSNGTKEYTFNDSKLGKIDIPGKYLNSTTATIEYKITIKNEGAVDGIAKKIVDYIPSDLNFDANANPGWYKDKDGNIYNNTLTNTIIKPGETKELTLVLTKKMTGENTGTIINRAEIYEDYNELGLKDYNSTTGNKAQGENDFDYANLIITVKTGQVAMYISITFISIAIIAIGAYEINKRVLKGGRI